jgi:mRNA interferase HigB
VRVIAKARIVEASAKHPEWLASLSTWYKIVTDAQVQWRHFPDVKQTWKNVDLVGGFAVFDIANNKCRLICHINHETGIIYIKHIFTHEEYKGWTP